MEPDSITESLLDAQRRMRSTIETLERELQTIRTGRANISILDDVHVDYYGSPTPLNQLASLSAPEPQMLLIQAYDKSSIGAIEKAILQSDLGLNPNNDGSVVRVPIPELTEERRHELAKLVGTIAENGKTAIRQVRRDANESLHALESAKEVSQDEERRAHKQVQDLTDKFCEEVDSLAEHKRQEILTL